MCPGIFETVQGLCNDEVLLAMCPNLASPCHGAPSAILFDIVGICIRVSFFVELVVSLHCLEVWQIQLFFYFYPNTMRNK